MKNSKKSLGALETTANERYQTNALQCLKKLELIKAALQKHAKAQAADPRNWGFVGEIADVNSSLEEVLNQLSA